MSTLADIMTAATGALWTGVDDTTPYGYFLATTHVLSLNTTYLLEGITGDLAAPIVGRIERHEHHSTAYRGDGLKGGTYVSSRLDDEAAFKKILGGRT